MPVSFHSQCLRVANSTQTPFERRISKIRSDSQTLSLMNRIFVIGSQLIGHACILSLAMSESREFNANAIRTSDLQDQIGLSDIESDEPDIRHRESADRSCLYPFTRNV